MAQIVSLSQMRRTVREMTARYTPQQMTDAQIDSFINLSYTIFLPLQYKNSKLTKPYTLLTVPNVDTYDFIYEDEPTNPQTGGRANKSPGNIEIGPPVYCQGYRLNYYQDKSVFYNLWPKLSINQQIGTGDDTSGPYSGTIINYPFLRAQLDIFGNVTEAAVIISAYNDTGYSYSISDQPNPGSNTGNLVDISGNVVGTVNYVTGAYTFTVANSAVIPSGSNIYASVVPYQAARPIAVLFYNQQIVLRPVPLQVFQIEFQISQQPTQLIEDNSAPELDEWYLFICAGAAKLIYTSFPDPEGEATLMPIWQEQLQLSQRRTLRQMSSQRVATIFSTPKYPSRGWAMGAEYSGWSA